MGIALKKSKAVAILSLAFYFLCVHCVSISSALEKVPSESGSKSLFQKLLVVKPKIDVEWHPDCRERGEVKPFNIFWRLKTGTPDNKKDGKFLAGNDEGSPYFYVDEDDVRLWDTKTALSPIPAVGDDEPFAVYDDTNESNKVAVYDEKEGQIAHNQKRLALITGKGQPESETDENLQVFPVIVFVGDTLPAGGKAAVINDVRELKVEIVFVCDTTKSMQPLIDTAKTLMQRVTEGIFGDLRQAKGAVRFGIVEYRDQGDDFISKVTLKLDADPSKTVRALGKIKVDGGGNVPEAVTTGLKTALDEAGWEENSSKHIILLGDAPNNTTFGPTIEQILKDSDGTGTTGAQIAKRTTTIHTVLAHGGGIPKDETALAHFAGLATGGEGGAPGLMSVVNTDIAAEKESSMNDFYNNISAIVKDLIKVRSGDSPRQILEGGSDAPTEHNKMSAPFRRILVSSGEDASGDSVAGYSSITTKDGEVVAMKTTLVLRSEILLLQSRLSQIIKRLSRIKKGDGDIAAFIEAMQKAAVEIIGGDETEQIVDADTTLEEIIGDLPMKTNALKLTIAQVAVMQPDDFDAWMVTLKDAKKRAAAMFDGGKKVWLPPNEIGDNPDQIGFFEKSSLP